MINENKKQDRTETEPGMGKQNSAATRNENYGSIQNKESIDNLPLAPVAPLALLVHFTKIFKHLRKYDG